MQTQWKSSTTFNIDVPLFLGLLLLCGIGLVVLYSASGQNMDMVIRQGIRICLGLFLLIVIAQFRVQTILRFAPWIYAIGIILLLLVFLLGTKGKGAQRWLNLGFIRFQPSEIIKIFVPMMVAWYFSDKALPPTGKQILTALIIIVIPVLMVAKQPDLGTSLLIAASGVFVILFAGLNWKLLLTLFITGTSVILMALFTPVLQYFLHPYQLKRIETFLNPEANPLGAGYHIIQSKIAIGSGGLYGKGLLEGTQSHLEFLPERHTDFIFSVFSEEFGLVGSIALLILYGFIITRGLFIASQAQGTFSRLLAGSLILTFFVYLFVNLGMVMGLLPVVGVPLPLISYGGTASITLLMGFGIIMAIHSHKRLLG